MSSHTDRVIELLEEFEKSASLISNGKGHELIYEILETTLNNDNENPIDSGKLQAQISGLEQRLAKCHSERDAISCKLAEYALEKERIKKLRGKQVGIIGGHITEIKKIETMLEKELGIRSKITPGEVTPPPYSKLKDKYRNVDLLIILNGYAGHALTGSAEKLSEEFGIRKIYDSADLLNSIKLKVIEALS